MSDASPQSVTDARTAILARMASAARAASREASAVTLTAVSKQQPWSKVAEALASGQTVFGENRVQEARERWSALREQGATLQLRLIGPLQSNKAKDAAAFFDVIETLDREKLAQALADAAQSLGRLPQLLVQINTGDEPQKAGVTPAETDNFLRLMQRDYALPIAGLMCIPPVNEPAGLHFCLLSEIAKRNGLGILSMGMSDDFETAIRFGATHVRVGSALFGARAH
jgi:PLP dependent protein